MIASPIRARFIYLLYRLVLIAGIPLVLLYFLLRVRRDRRYLHRFSERLGWLGFPYEPTPAGSIWLHAVSVGEVISAIPLIAALRREYPAAPVFVSVTTVAGRAIAEEKLTGMVDGLFYAPLDYVSVVRRVLGRLRPTLVIVMETEIWPNLYREVKRTGAALAVVNGRISDRAFPRYLPWKWMFGEVLAHPDIVLAQSEEDRRRYIALGAPAERVEAAGNLKYDFNPAAGEIPREVREFVEHAAPREILIAASTMPPRDADDVDEDDIVIAEYRKLAVSRSGLLMILVPRRPERFEVAAAKLTAAGIPFVRRSALPAAAAPALPCVLLLDSMGELSRLFSMADVVFMGGTFPRRGGHNILEPAFFGKAVIAGPHMENFAAIAGEFTDSGALVRVDAPDRLAATIGRLLSERDERERVGSKARELAAAKRGVTQRLTGRLMELYFGTLPLRRGWALLEPLSALWRWENRRRQENAKPRSLDIPVASIGGLTMGGTGKTPMVDWMAAELKLRGLQPAILTRGYRRRSPEAYVIVRAGSKAPPELTGDEPQVYLRRGAAHLGVGADRWQCGRRLLEQLDADVFVLDDGFQHWKLKRDLDIVMIDALDPFGGGSVFPRGMLREPLDGLRRARAFVITRVEPGLRTDAIERELRKWNAAAPIFRSRVVPRRWIETGTGRAFSSAPFEKAAAFCGLANPRAFWRTLEAMGIHPEPRWTFGDHHRYRSQDLRRLGQRARKAGVDALITTEKDAANLCGEASKLVGPTPVYALEIGIAVENGERLIEMVAGLVKSCRTS